jgi:diguanylate cyclase (GGDEF)-like protein
VLLAGAAVVVLLVAVRHLLRSWWRDRAALRRAEGALTARTTEIATLHAIGREILATLDTERVFAIVERECRKVFDVDRFLIGVLDRDTGQTRPWGGGLASWVMKEKRDLRIDDLAAGARELGLDSGAADGDIRSVLAVPLLVEGNAVGVLSVQSRRPGAYDDHQLAVLATIGQQAAVAVENARHHALATVDSLTGLYLRDTFFRRLQEEHARARRYDGAYVLLMIDLDGFKGINDREGHLAGDRYLRAAGAAIRSRLRAADLACRYGGDEFCVLLPETDLDGAAPIAERLRAAIADLVVDLDAGSVRTTCSIGAAAHPDHAGGDVRALLLRADQALYQAKRAGRDRVAAYGAASRAQDVLNPAPRAREERLGQ